MPIEVEELVNKRLKELAESGKRCDLILPNLYTLEENQRNRRKPMYREFLEHMQAQQEAVCNVQSFLESYIDLCRIDVFLGLNISFSSIRFNFKLTKVVLVLIIQPSRKNRRDYRRHSKSNRKYNV